MTRVWYLRDETYRALHQWPVLLAFALLGCLGGWAASLVWPSYYRAAAQMYVSINPYRSLEDARFLAVSRPKYSNVDDYKNWQMSQLESAVFLEEILRDTLTDLQQTDPYWQDFDTADLRSMLEADWRSAGTWSLVAKHPQAKRAEQLSAAWGAAAQKEVSSAIQASQNTLMVDLEIQAAAAEMLKTQSRRETLDAALAQLDLWREEALKTPQDADLSANLEWQIRSLASQLADFSPAWVQLLNEQPKPGSPAAAFVEWSEQISAQIEAELPMLAERIGSLEQKRVGLREQYSFESDNSLGLSPTLEVLGMDDRPAQAVRPSAALILLGGVGGLFGWLLFVIIRISLTWSSEIKKTTQLSKPEKPETQA